MATNSRSLPAVPRVSVLLPSHNYGRFIWQAIESVLAQDFCDYELIISDDASTDCSAEIIAEYAARDRRIRAFAQPKNLGMVENWNWTLRQARGHYVKFIFGDDCFADAAALTRLVRALDEHPDASLATSARLLIDEDSRVVGKRDELSPGVHRGADVIRQCLMRNRNLIGEPTAVLFRAHAAARGFDRSLQQIVDQEFWIHLLQRGDLVHLAEPLCAFREHAAQQTRMNQRAHIGPMESLLVLARYLASISDAEQSSFTPAQRRQAVFHCLYYSRKKAPRAPNVLAAEAALAAYLKRPWYLLLWLRHRLTKPWLNLRRYCRSRCGSAERAARQSCSNHPTRFVRSIVGEDGRRQPVWRDATVGEPVLASTARVSRFRD